MACGLRLTPGQAAEASNDGQKGQIGDPLAIGKTRALDRPATLLHQRLRELVDQAALANARLPHHRHDLPRTLLGALPGFQETPEFGSTPHKAG